jgi:hypothetical protein
VANPNESAWQHMQQKAPQELVGADGHGPLLIAMGVILPPERDLAVLESNQSVVGDGNTMSILSEVMQYVFGSAEGPFCIHDPVLPEELWQSARWVCRPGRSTSEDGKRIWAVAKRLNPEMSCLQRGKGSAVSIEAVKQRGRQKRRTENSASFPRFIAKTTVSAPNRDARNPHIWPLRVLVARDFPHQNKWLPRKRGFQQPLRP